MKTLITLLIALALGTTATTAKTITITIENIRNNLGQILVMATIAGQEKPAYGKADAKEGSVVVTLTGIEAEVAEISLFHDEDGDFKMKMGDRGPLEGCARQKSVLSEEQHKTWVKIHYPKATEGQSK